MEGVGAKLNSNVRPKFLPRLIGEGFLGLDEFPVAISEGDDRVVDGCRCFGADVDDGFRVRSFGGIEHAARTKSSDRVLKKYARLRCRTASLRHRSSLRDRRRLLSATWSRIVITIAVRPNSHA